MKDSHENSSAVRRSWLEASGGVSRSKWLPLLGAASVGRLKRIGRVGSQASGGNSPWLTVKEAARRARCGKKTIYREVRAGRLRAAHLGGRRELRLKPEWVDDWLENKSREVAA